MPTKNESDRFFEILSQHPKLAIYWDREKDESDITSFEQALEKMSSGEASFAKWLAGVWLHENRFGFDLFNDFSKLQGKQLQVFRDWVNNPFYP